MSWSCADCMSCEETGYQTRGYAKFKFLVLPNGKKYVERADIGDGGWDCTSKCSAGAKQGPTGTQQWVTFKRCFGSG